MKYTGIAPTETQIKTKINSLALELVEDTFSSDRTQAKALQLIALEMYLTQRKEDADRMAALQINASTIAPLVEDTDYEPIL